MAHHTPLLLLLACLCLTVLNVLGQFSNSNPHKLSHLFWGRLPFERKDSERDGGRGGATRAGSVNNARRHAPFEQHGRDSRGCSSISFTTTLANREPKIFFYFYCLPPGNSVNVWRLNIQCVITVSCFFLGGRGGGVRRRLLGSFSEKNEITYCNIIRGVYS